MIVFLSTRQHADTLKTLRDGSFGAGLPDIRLMAYEDVLLAEYVPAATYVFTDIERLTEWERVVAAELFGALRDAGCRCLNNPAGIKTRYAMLRALHHAGVNPFRIWRLDDAILAGLIAGEPGPPDDPPGRSLATAARRLLGRAKPAAVPAIRFPVFFRLDSGHDGPLTDPLPDHTALVQAVEQLARDGFAPSTVMMIEYCAQPIAEGAWYRFGTMRVGETISVDHAVIEDRWIVKHGSLGLATDAMIEWEHRQVAENAPAGAVASAFAISGIEYGRADHATVEGREVIYEINTNPTLLGLTPQRRPLRDETLRIARERMAAAMHAIDGGGGEALRIARGPRGMHQAERKGFPAMQFRP